MGSWQASSSFEKTSFFWNTSSNCIFSLTYHQQHHSVKVNHRWEQASDFLAGEVEVVQYHIWQDRHVVLSFPGERNHLLTLRMPVPKDQAHPDSLWKQSWLREWRYGSNQVLLEQLLRKRKNLSDWTQKITKIVYYYCFKHPVIIFSWPHFKAQLFWA